MLTISQKRLFHICQESSTLSMVSTVCQGTLLRSLKSLSGFKFLNDLVLMIVCSLLVECLLRTTATDIISIYIFECQMLISS